MPEERAISGGGLRKTVIPELHGKILKPLQPGAFLLELTSEQQEALAKLVGEAGGLTNKIEVQLVEGKIAPASVLVGLSG